jgi:hypothetical protein
VEWTDAKHFAYTPSKMPVADEDGNVEYLWHTLEIQAQNADDNLCNDHSPCEEAELIAEEFDVAEDTQHITAVEDKVRGAIWDMLDKHEVVIDDPYEGQKIIPIVEYSDNVVFKSTLVSQFNGNPFLSKDRLTRIRNLIYFNNADEHLSAANSETTCLLGLGSDCGVYMIQKSTTMASRAAGRPRRSKVTSNMASNIYAGIDQGTWWIGRVRKMRHKLGNKWDPIQQSIDLMNRMVTWKSAMGPTIEGRMYWFSGTASQLKFKYDHVNCKWIDIDSIISTVSLAYSSTTKFYTLYADDFASFNEFVENHA